MYAYDVYVKRHNKLKLIDTVFFTRPNECEYVKQSLINHDGYSSGIIVKERKNNHE